MFCKIIWGVVNLHKYYTLGLDPSTAQNSSLVQGAPCSGQPAQGWSPRRKPCSLPALQSGISPTQHSPASSLEGISTTGPPPAPAVVSTLCSAVTVPRPPVPLAACLATDRGDGLLLLALSQPEGRAHIVLPPTQTYLSLPGKEFAYYHPGRSPLEESSRFNTGHWAKMFSEIQPHTDAFL